MPDYDLEQIDQPTPRDVDGVLVSQGFRDLVDDTRGILTELLATSNLTRHRADMRSSTFRTPTSTRSNSMQLTGAICPGDDEVYRPGLWIVLHDRHANQKASLPQATKERISAIAHELMKRLQLEA